MQEPVARKQARASLVAALNDAEAIALRGDAQLEEARESLTASQQKHAVNEVCVRTRVFVRFLLEDICAGGMFVRMNHQQKRADSEGGAYGRESLIVVHLLKATRMGILFVRMTPHQKHAASEIRVQTGVILIIDVVLKDTRTGNGLLL